MNTKGEEGSKLRVRGGVKNAAHEQNKTQNTTTTGRGGREADGDRKC